MRAKHVVPPETSLKPPLSESISIHRALAHSLPEFLKRENLADKETSEAIGSLIALLSHYREEGQRLFPEVFFFNDISNILGTLPNSERIVIGMGAKTPATMDLAMKRCAALAQWGWSIYVLRTATNFEYGLLRCGLTALSLTAFELLIEQGDQTLPAVAIRHISQQTMELSGARGNALRITVGHTILIGDDPLQIADRFCSSVVSAVPAGVREQVHNFYWRIFCAVLKGGHGTLAIALESKRNKLPAKFTDGVAMVPPIDVATKVHALLNSNNCESDTKLRAIAALIKGMLQTDGVTVFATNGSVRAYNVFVKDTKMAEGSSTAIGGARRRAYASLCSWIGHDVHSAFFLSQDGHAECAGNME
jgi:hypothetical protein